VLRKLAADHDTTTLISGMAVGADQLAARAAVDTGMRLWSYLPHPQQADRWPPSARERWTRLRAAAARDVVLADGYDVANLHNRNRLMIRDSAAIVAIHDPPRTTGGTHQALHTADTMRRPLIESRSAQTPSFRAELAPSNGMPVGAGWKDRVTLSGRRFLVRFTPDQSSMPSRLPVC
jgi:hypothetical protein